MHAMLDATSTLREVPPRFLFHDESRERWFTQAEALALPADARALLVQQLADEDFYYTTKYGSPLAYARAFDIVAPADASAMSWRVLDVGYGGVGHLRLLATLGADATGVDVDPMLRALYAAPEDTGRIGRGRVTLVSGSWPGDADVARTVGGGFDLIISKNVLKNGYIHPEQPVPERQRIRLGVDDDAYVGALFAATRPGGKVLLYNLCPAPSPPGKPYIPWADGRSPFPAATWEKAGFRVIALDRDDGAAARAMGRALGWDVDDDLEKDLFASYTLVERPK
jgi:hypothetical protein